MISVRRIRIGEAELFKQIRLNSLHQSPSAFGSTYESALRRSPESWREQADGAAQGSDRATFMAFSGDAPIGISALYRDGKGTGTGEMLQVWVSPEYRGRGVAIEIMDAVFQWAAENGLKTVIALVAKDNARALSFYRKAGFQLANDFSPDVPNAFVLMKEIDAQRADTAEALPHAEDV